MRRRPRSCGTCHQVQPQIRKNIFMRQLLGCKHFHSLGSTEDSLDNLFFMLFESQINPLTSDHPFWYISSINLPTDTNRVSQSCTKVSWGDFFPGLLYYRTVRGIAIWSNSTSCEFPGLQTQTNEMGQHSLSKELFVKGNWRSGKSVLHYINAINHLCALNQICCMI